MFAIAPTDPDSPDARILLAELGAALAGITGSDGSASFDSASFTMRWISDSLRPDDAVMVMRCSLAVPLSLACTLRMPLASMSKVTSICGTPRGAGGMPSRWKRPISLLSRAIGRSPCVTTTSTDV